MSVSLWNQAVAIADILAKIEDGELTGGLEEQLDSQQLPFAAKAQNICKLIEQLQGDAATVTNAIDRLRHLRSFRLKAIERLKAYLVRCMGLAQTDRLELEYYRLSRVKNSAPSVDLRDFLREHAESELPSEFQRVIIQANKLALGKAWKEGRPLPNGITCEYGYHLQGLNPPHPHEELIDDC